MVFPGWSAHFRIEKWDNTKDVPYRLRHGEKATFEGLIRKDPVDKDVITVANMSCNSSRTPGQRQITHGGASDAAEAEPLPPGISP